MRQNPFGAWLANREARSATETFSYERKSAVGGGQLGRSTCRFRSLIGNGGSGTVSAGQEGALGPRRIKPVPEGLPGSNRTHGRAGTIERAPKRFMEWGGRMEAR